MAALVFEALTSKPRHKSYFINLVGSNLTKSFATSHWKKGNETSREEWLDSKTIDSKAQSPDGLTWDDTSQRHYTFDNEWDTLCGGYGSSSRQQGFSRGTGLGLWIVCFG
jgi:hypothetical protein